MANVSVVSLPTAFVILSAAKDLRRIVDYSDPSLRSG